MPKKRASQKAKSDNVFGHAGKRPKMFSAWGGAIPSGDSREQDL
jgi:hypothetical protein